MGEATRTIGEIDSTDKEIIKELKNQTSTLQDTTKKIQDAEEYYNRSNSVIKNMMSRVFTNKLVLYAIIILLGLLIMFILFIKIKYKVFGAKK